MQRMRLFQTTAGEMTLDIFAIVAIGPKMHRRAGDGGTTNQRKVHLLGGFILDVNDTPELAAAIADINTASTLSPVLESAG